MKKLPVAVAISGSGSNLQALIDACNEPDYPAKIVLVVSNKSNAFGLERAKKAGIPSVTISHTDYPDRESFDTDLNKAIIDSGAEFVCLAGFMRILTDDFINNWRDKMINIHPSLLPKYKGLHTHARAIEAGDSHHGTTVHFVRAELDSGPLIIQASVPILEKDEPDDLASRVLKEEHQIYPKALAWIASGKIEINGEDAFIDGVKGPILLDDLQKNS